MAFTGRIRLHLPVETARSSFPGLETWLRLSPEWSVLEFLPEALGNAIRLRLRLEHDEREVDMSARLAVLDDGWQLELVGDGRSRTLEFSLTPTTDGCELGLRDEGIADDDGPARTAGALWLRATADYMLLSVSSRWRHRLAKRLLDRLWLRMSLTGRRVVILVVAYETVGFAFLMGWLVWEHLAG